MREKPKSTPKHSPAGTSKTAKRTAGDVKTTILDLINRSPHGIDVPTIRAKTRLETVKIRNTVYQAHRQGLIEKVSRGVYRGKTARLSTAEQIQLVADAVNRSPGGIGVALLIEQTGLAAQRVRYALTRALATGTIRRQARGVYGPILKKPATKSMRETVLGLIPASNKGISFTHLLGEAGIKEKQLRNIVYRLLQQGHIRSVARGVYATVVKR